ncbi:Uncharacterised protein [Actinobacillus pleuropneumoniae]|nr:Uncharacterised protein [Actinobacillus pleuropneumoniae]
MRLYTRDEYKANNGYRDRLDGIGQVTYTVYALSSEDGEMALIRQEDEANRIRFSTGKAKLVYSIREKSRWLQPYKTIEIQVTAEVPVPKEALCYVKKQGAYPVNKEDGILYPVRDGFCCRTQRIACDRGGQERLRSPVFYGRQEIWTTI